MIPESEKSPVDSGGPAEEVEQADISLGRAIASKRNHPWVQWCCGVGEMGDQGPLYLIGASMVAAGLFRKSPRASLAGMSLLAAVAVADVTKSTIKRLVKRSRPNTSLDKGGYRFEAGGSPRKEEQSFPSGHVAGTVAAARVISRYYPSAAPYAGTTATVISLSRIVKGSHWPLDLVAGLVIGLAADRAVRSAIRSIFR